jgi:hypothetical protein
MSVFFQEGVRNYRDTAIHPHPPAVKRFCFWYIGIRDGSMTLSDENTIIRHRDNACVNHPDRVGRNLCVECGRWFCDDCMSSTHKYLCGRCAAEAIEEAGRHRGSSPSRLSLPLVFGGLFLLFFLLGRVGIGLIALPIAFFILVKHMFGGRRNVFSVKHVKPARKIFLAKKNEDITEEQLATLLRLGGGRVTAEKLARAADVSVKTAKKFLDKQVVEGTLDVEAGDSELIYLKK